MKKFLASLLTLCFVGCSVIGLSACNADNGKDNANSGLTSESTVTLTKAEKTAIVNGEYGSEAQSTSSSSSSSKSYFGVGRTINVITDEYISVSSSYVKIFDTDKLTALNWNRTYVGKMSATSIIGSSMDEYYEEFNTSYKASFSAGASVDAFSASVDSQFGFTAKDSYKNTQNGIFGTYSQIYAANLVEIDEYRDLTQFKNILSSAVLTDAQSVQNGTMSEDNFMEKYGTHVILAGYYGGRIDASYYLRNVGTTWSSSEEASYKAEVSAKMADIGSLSAGTSSSINDSLQISHENSEEHFSASSIGGNNFQALTLSDFSNNYGNWVSSMNDNTEYSNIVGLPQRSLVAIWDLFPDSYSQASQKLSTYFNNLAASSSSEFLNKYFRIISEDTINFDGGNGTASKPYLISTAEQFKNIASDNGGKYYKLTADINLGNWKYPFDFSGQFNGSNHSITYSQTLGTSGTIYGGLFATLNNAEIKNLKLNVTIKDQEGDFKANVGGLAGKVTGSSNISKIKVSGSISFDDWKGNDYLGGIVGQIFGGNIDQCANEATIVSRAYDACIGGIAGYANATDNAICITNCYNVGNLTAYTAYVYGGRSAGGIVGHVNGDSNNRLDIETCYNDSEVKTIQAKNAALGWWGCGGIFGDIQNKNSTNIFVTDCYWNSTKSDLYGNNESYHKNNKKIDMSGDYDNWSNAIWEFSADAAPKLLWLE